MIDSLIIFSKTGLVLYLNSSSKLNIAVLNYFISNVLLDGTKISSNKKCNINHLQLPPQIAEWEENENSVCVVFYSHVLEGRKDMSWVQGFCKAILKEFDESNNNFDLVYNALITKFKQQKCVTTTKPIKRVSSSNKMKAGGKKNTVWHDGTAKITKSALAQLDRSKDSTVVDADTILSENNSQKLKETRATYLPTSTYEIEDDEDDTLDSSPSYFSNIVATLTGRKILTESDVEGPLTEMEKLLKSKNVSSSIATEICNAVRVDSIGKRLPVFMSISAFIRSDFEMIIRKMLQPEEDIIHQIWRKRQKSLSTQKKEPYVIVFVGINGVGKSTSLAKVAYYLKQRNCTPLLAACDTFRAGAIEQLAVHAKCLDLPLFQKGYAKDSSIVAKDAIEYASQNGNDVVLIDTAGRMQNNVPLMKALSKLVYVNQPDKVIFVCEALVGNDGVDELEMFDSALRNGAAGKNFIDGIILTKFDTVSDKVGAALIMSRNTGAKVLFIGIGQKYNHLKKLSPNIVINELFS